VAREQPAADPIERVSLVAAVSQAGLLGAAAHLVERGVGQTDDVEVIDHQAGLGQSSAHRGGIGLIGVDHHVVDRSQPTGGLGAEPGGHRGGAASS
jgi:hypothetical protein